MALVDALVLGGIAGIFGLVAAGRHPGRFAVKLLFLQGEVAGVQQVNAEVLEIALVEVGLPCREDRVIFTPDDQRRWLEPAEIGLLFRVLRHIVLVNRASWISGSPSRVRWRNSTFSVIRADRLHLSDPVGGLPFYPIGEMNPAKDSAFAGVRSCQ